MTVHASKGLEFKQVFIVGVEEDLFPSAMSKNSEREIEEERRLLYVAITRAEENCTLTYALSRYRNGQTVSSPPSRFIKDLDSRYVDMPVQTKQSLPEKPYRGTDFHSMRKDRAKLPDGTKKIRIAHLHRDHSLLRLRANG